MHALVDQLAAAGKPRVGPPLLFVTETSAMPVTAAEKHQLADLAAVDELARLLQRGMKAMVVADAHRNAATVRFDRERFEFARADGAGLFDEHMLPGLHRREGER